MGVHPIIMLLACLGALFLILIGGVAVMAWLEGDDETATDLFYHNLAEKVLEVKRQQDEEWIRNNIGDVPKREVATGGKEE